MKVGYSVEIAGSLLRTKASVEVRADTTVTGVADKLGNVVNMVGDSFEGGRCDLW